MIFLERKGSTLHLLKQSSKPVPQVRKRRKLNVFGEQPANAEMVDCEGIREEVKAAQVFGQSTPNIIGNQEDKQSSGSLASSFKPPYDPNQSGHNIFGQPKMTQEGGKPFNPNSFETISPKRTEDQKERRQQQVPPY